MNITGKFDISLEPMESYSKGVEGVSLARMSIDKIFHGNLSGESKGEMLSAITEVAGSAGYVAIEQVVGSVCGKSGSFVLQHFGTMADGDDKLILEVVPNSGTGDLVGLTGEMQINRVQDQHYYIFDYSGV